MRIRLALIAAFFIVVSCSMPGEPADSFTIEDYKLSISFENDRYESDDLKQVDALIGSDATVVEVKSIKINAFINNQTEYSKVLFEVNAAADTTFSGDLSGDIKTLIKIWVIQNPAGTDGYFLNDPAVIAENPDLQIDSEGLTLDGDVIDMLLQNDSYLKSTLRLSEGGAPVLGENDYIESRVSIYGHFVIKIDGE